MASEIDEILEYINQGYNFLLSGGAGSGKTHTLVEVINRIRSENPYSKIACITFTNVAVEEIKNRVNHEGIQVSTIHDFLWATIKSFQKNIKKALLGLIQKENEKEKTGIKYLGEEDLSEEYFKTKEIKYREWTNLEKGDISHDEVIKIASYMFEEYTLLCDVIKDKFDYIFIDEYQDTFPEVIKIFLDHLSKSKKHNIIGFFGDSMQAIYDEGVGNINENVENNKVKEIIKQDNRRNPQLVIDLANTLRLDSLCQKPAQDRNAPNYRKMGSIKFLFSKNEDVNIEDVKNTKHFEDWDFRSHETKELYLTERLIAGKAKFERLLDIYDNKEPIFELIKTINTEIRNKNVEISDDTSLDEIVEQMQLQSKVKNINLYEQVKNIAFFKIRKMKPTDKSQLIGIKKSSEDDTKKGNKRDKLITHLFHIQECIYLYKTKQYNEFIKKTNFKVSSVGDKKNLAEYINTLQEIKSKTIGEVIDFADKTGIWRKNQIEDFINNKPYLYDRVRETEYQELWNLYEYVEGKTPFSTQKGIKGAEFDNVFVILDNGKWNLYNFKTLFGDGQSNQNVTNRTRKIFYVCCTRAKSNLIVFFHKPSDKVIQTAEEWFGKNNVCEV